MSQKKNNFKDKVLILLSSKLALEPALKYCSEHHPDKFVDLLVVKSDGLMEPVCPEGRVYVLPADSFQRDALEPSLLTRLRKNKYACGIVLYNDIKRSDYFNVEKVARKIPCDKYIGIDKNKTSETLRSRFKLNLYSLYHKITEKIRGGLVLLLTSGFVLLCCVSYFFILIYRILHHGSLTPGMSDTQKFSGKEL